MTAFAFIGIDGDELLYKFIGYLMLPLQIPLLVSDLIYVTDTGTGGALVTQTLALDATTKSTFVLINVLFQFFFLFHMWSFMKAEET